MVQLWCFEKIVMSSVVISGDGDRTSEMQSLKSISDGTVPGGNPVLINDVLINEYMIVSAQSCLV